MKDKKKLTEKDIKTVIKKTAPMSLRKQKLLISLSVFFVMIMIGIFFLIVPFANNKSLLDVFKEKWAKDFSAIDVLNFMSPWTSLLLIAWGISLRTIETRAYFKKRNQFNKHNERRGIKMTKKQTIHEIELREWRINEVMENILNTTRHDQEIIVRGSTPFEIRQILEEYDLEVDEKIEKIKEKLKGFNVDINSKKIIKALKETKKI